MNDFIFAILSECFPIFSWFSATVTAYQKQLSSLFCFVAFLYLIYSRESMYNPPPLRLILILVIQYPPIDYNYPPQIVPDLFDIYLKAKSKNSVISSVSLPIIIPMLSHLACSVCFSLLHVDDMNLGFIVS